MSKRAEKHARPPKRKAKGFILNYVLIALMAASAIITGLALPGAAAAFQTKSVDRLSRQEELGSGALTLTNDEAKLEKFRVMELVFHVAEPHKIIELDEGRFLTEAGAKEALGDISKILDGTGLFPDFTEDSAGAERRVEKVYMVLPLTENYQTAIIWEVCMEYKDSSGKGTELEICVDDATGLITWLAIRCEGGMKNPGDRGQILQKLAENLSSYYGFGDIDLAAQSPEELKNSFSDDSYIYFYRGSQKLMELKVDINQYGLSIGF